MVIKYNNFYNSQLCIPNQRTFLCCMTIYRVFIRLQFVRSLLIKSGHINQCTCQVSTAGNLHVQYTSTRARVTELASMEYYHVRHIRLLVYMSYCFSFLPSQRVYQGQNRHQVSPPQRHQSSKRGKTPGYRNGTESFFGLKGRPSVVRDV